MAPLPGQLLDPGGADKIPMLDIVWSYYEGYHRDHGRYWPGPAPRRCSYCDCSLAAVGREVLLQSGKAWSQPVSCVHGDHLWR